MALTLPGGARAPTAPSCDVTADPQTSDAYGSLAEWLFWNADGVSIRGEEHAASTVTVADARVHLDTLLSC